MKQNVIGNYAGKFISTEYNKSEYMFKKQGRLKLFQTASLYACILFQGNNLFAFNRLSGSSCTLIARIKAISASVRTLGNH